MTKQQLYNIVNQQILNQIPEKELANKLNLHIGTIKRWVLKQEIPLDYFNHINKLLNYSLSQELTEEEHFKNMDQFFTPETVAIDCIHQTINFISENYNINLKQYTFIEPSAGAGAFYHNIPTTFNKIGLDIEPNANDIQKQDWLDYIPTTNKNIVIGNPPFGLRGALALQFINHAADFADFVCFILPPLFNSNGKGSPMLRIDSRYKLVKEIAIENKNFNYPNLQPVQVNSIFQIWTKLDSDKVQPINKNKLESEYIKIYSLSNGNTPSTQRNVKMINHCDFYLPSTTFKSVELYTNFNQLPHNRGYGIVILKDNPQQKQLIQQTLQAIDWQQVSFKSTNSANNLRTDLIIHAFHQAFLPN